MFVTKFRMSCISLQSQPVTQGKIELNGRTRNGVKTDFWCSLCKSLPGRDFRFDVHMVLCTLFLLGETCELWTA